MYSLDQLLSQVNAERADGLSLHVGAPPAIVLRGEHRPVSGPAITVEDALQLLQGLANSRQRRELRERGGVQFVYRFRESTDFVVRATVQDEQVQIDIH